MRSPTPRGAVWISLSRHSSGTTRRRRHDERLQPSPRRTYEGGPLSMRPGLSAREVGLQIGRAVLEAEHRHFVAEMLDNEEYVPRILRIAAAVASGLESCDPHQHDVAGVRDALESYGRDLFLSEWKARLMEEAEQ